MTTLREVLFITTGADAALQRTLAARSRVMTDVEQLALDVEVFPHSYAPEEFRAWLAVALNPVVRGGRALDLAPAARPTLALPPGSIVTTTRDAQGRATVLVQEPGSPGGPLPVVGTPVVGTPVGPAVVTQDAQGRTTVVVGTPVPPAGGVMLGTIPLTSLAPRSSGPGAPDADYGARERLFDFLDSLSPAEQTQVVTAQIESLMKALRSLNVSAYAFERLRRVIERVWGYFDPAADQYLDGVPSGMIVDRLQGAAYQPGTAGEWRERLAAAFRGRFPQLYQFSAVETVFGLEQDYNTATIGCRAGADDVRLPNSCYAPTGECHRVWFQPNGALRGGRLYTPGQMKEAVDAVENRDVLDQVARMFTGDLRRFVTDAQYGWRTPLFEAHTPSFGQWRLHVLAPLAWYWLLFFGAQPEFEGMSFAEWLFAQDPRELIRSVRRENTLRNAAMASRWGTRIEELVGAGEANAARALAEAERRRQRVDGYVQVGAEAVTSIAGAITPIAGLVAGAVTSVARVVVRLSTEPEARVHVDVYGQLMPAFSAFAMEDDRRAFQSTMERQVGMPQVPASRAVPDPSGPYRPPGTSTLPVLAGPTALQPVAPTPPPVPSRAGWYAALAAVAALGVGTFIFRDDIAERMKSSTR